MHEAGYSLAGFIFAAGIFYATTRAEIAQIKKDMNGLGNRLRVSDDEQKRKHTNIGLALMLIAPVDKEKEVCDFLREG